MQQSAPAQSNSQSKPLSQAPKDKEFLTDIEKANRFKEEANQYYKDKKLEQACKLINHWSFDKARDITNPLMCSDSMIKWKTQQKQDR